MQPGIYKGIFSQGEIPKSCIHKQYHHSERHHGKEVKYYEVWVENPDTLKPPFQENEEPNPQKIGRMQSALKKMFGL